MLCVSITELVGEILAKELPDCLPSVVCTDSDTRSFSAPESRNTFKVVLADGFLPVVTCFGMT